MDLRELPQSPFERHPWEAARASFFVDIVQRQATGPVSVLDVGAGDGYLGRRLLDALPRGSRVACVDLHYTPAHLESLAKDAPPGLTFSREAPSATVDWLLLLDVLEHVPDDVAMLGDLSRLLLRPGGTALISVPAWPALYTEHDVVLGHFRRYRPPELVRLVARAGLERVEGGSLFSSLLLPRFFAKVLERARGKTSVPVTAVPEAAADTAVAAWKAGRAVTAAVRLVLAADGKAGRALSRVGIPVPGLSVWAAARLPEHPP